MSAIPFLFIGVIRYFRMLSPKFARSCENIRSARACSLYMYEAVLCIFGRITIMQASRLTSLVPRIITTLNGKIFLLSYPPSQ